MKKRILSLLLALVLVMQFGIVAFAEESNRETSADYYSDWEDYKKTYEFKDNQMTEYSGLGKYEGGYKSKEIAEVIGISPSLIRMRLSRINEKMRKQIKKKMNE